MRGVQGKVGRCRVKEGGQLLAVCREREDGEGCLNYRESAGWERLLATGKEKVGKG